MSGNTAELLDRFERLSLDEKQEFSAEVFRRCLPFDSGPLDDEETAHAADQLLSTLDDEEIDDPTER